MYFLYVDTSGDEGWPPPVGLSPTRHYISLGVAIKPEDWRKLATSLEKIVRTYFPNPWVNPAPKELHYSELIAGRKPYDKLSGAQRRALADDIFQVIMNIGPTLFAVAIDKEAHYRKYARPEPPHRLGISFLIPRFNMFLLRNNDVGAIVIDSEQDKKDQHLRYYINEARGVGIIRIGAYGITPFSFRRLSLT